MKKRMQGVTLIELGIVIAILSIVVGIAVTLLTQGVQTAQTTENRDAMDWGAREGLERMSREFRSIRPSLITTLTASQLTYTSIEGESVSFVYSGSNLTRNGQNLLTNLSNFSFTYYTGAGATTSTASSVRLIQLMAIFTQDGLTSPTYYTAVATNVT